MVDTMYPVLVTLHSILRWVIVLAGLFAIIRAITGLSFKRGYMLDDDRAGKWFNIALDIQLLIGIILFFLRFPGMDLSGAMSDPVQRFFAVEHTSLMLLAVIVAHVARSMARRATVAASKHKRILIGFIIAMLIILAAIPWPFLPAGAGRGWF